MFFVKITSTIKESLDGVRTIQAFNLERRMESKLEAEGSFYIQMRKKIHALIESMGPITEFIATFLVLAVMYYFSVNSVISYAQTFAFLLLDLGQQKRYKITDICLILQRDLR